MQGTAHSCSEAEGRMKMEGLKAWSVTLAMVMIFASLAETILPPGGVSKYVRLAVGLLLTITLACPVLRLKNADIDMDMTDLYRSDAVRMTDKMEERQRAEVIALYKEKLNLKISAAVLEDTGGSEFEVFCEVCENPPERFGEIESVRIVFASADTAEKDEELKEKIALMYGIKYENIKIEYNAYG